MINIFLFILILECSFAKQSFFYISEKNSPSHDLYKFNLKNKELTKITSRIANSHYPHYNHPKLSPDGQTILIQADPRGHDRYTIWTMNLDGSDLKELSDKEGLYPNWSADGKSVYYSGRRSGTWEILEFSLSEQKERFLTSNYKLAKPPGWGATMTANPDGQSIIFSYVREKVLYELNFKSKTTKRISSLDKSFTHPNFSHDGKKLAVHMKGENAYQLVVYDLSNHQTMHLSNNVYSYYGASWSKDDSEILFTAKKNDRAEIFKIDLKTKISQQLTDDKGFNMMPIYLSNHAHKN